MPDRIHAIDLAQIDETALTRDRIATDEAALTELRLSIIASGLRMPVELFELAQETPAGQRYGVISGFRRLACFRSLSETARENIYAEIPAFIRHPENAAQAFAAMVEENEVRLALSPWERGRVAVTARDQSVFATLEEAVDALYASAPRQKRAKLKTIARLAEDIDGLLAAPESLKEYQLMRLACAMQNGFGEVIETALNESSLTDPASQWQAILPILVENEHPDPEPVQDPRPGRPRRVTRPQPGVTVRREIARDGWRLHFTGRDATGPLMDLLLDEIDRLLGPR